MTEKQKEFQNKLFPNGQPTPEEFILKIAEIVRKEIAEKSEK